MVRDKTAGQVNPDRNSAGNKLQHVDVYTKSTVYGELKTPGDPRVDIVSTKAMFAGVRSIVNGWDTVSYKIHGQSFGSTGKKNLMKM